MDLIGDDDDFGELYADVEAQGCSAINGGVSAPPPGSFCQPHIQPEKEDRGNFVSDWNKCSGSSVVAELTRLDNGASDSESEKEDEEEDDLNIVLNDDVCRPRSGGYEEHNEEEGEEGEDGGVIEERNNNELLRNRNSLCNSHYKYVRGDKSTIPIPIPSDVGRVDGSYRGEWEDNSTKSVVRRQCGYSFSLPSYWTIMDVNIDMFREKPWSYPGVDLTDYFNFGLDENSWKEYCNSLEQFQRQTHMQSGIPVYQSSKFKQAFEVGSEHYKVSKTALVEDITKAVLSSLSAGGGKRPPELASKHNFLPFCFLIILRMPRGRAIEVQSSICERRPSVDVKCAHNQDSDVVIKITLLETDDIPSDSGKGEQCQMDGNVHETPKDGVSYVNDNRCVGHSGSASGDESVGSLKGSLGESSSCRRYEFCWKRIILQVYSCMPSYIIFDGTGKNVFGLISLGVPNRTASNQISSDSESHGANQISDVVGHHHEKVSLHNSEGIDEAMEAAERVGRNSCQLDPRIIETELSAADRSHFSPTPSSFGSEFEASENDICGDLHDIDLGAKLHESITPDHSGPKMKMSDTKNGLRCRSPIQMEQKHHSRIHHIVSEQKFYHLKMTLIFL